MTLRGTEHEAAAGLLAAQRADCLTQLSRLEREFAGIIESGAGGSDDEHDPEGATLAYERQHLAALVSQVRQHLAQIDASVRRLQDGSYGQCAGCGQPIGAARLAARPTTTTCVGCARRR
jgi:DnaK suppressor protein